MISYNQKKAYMIILMVLAFFLSGCSYSQQMDKKFIKLYESRVINQKATVYAVKFKQNNTVMSVKKFGVTLLEKDMIDITHGLSYEIDLDDMGMGTLLELKMRLKRHQYNSVDDFINAFSVAKAILPGSDYRALPKKLGSELFFIALKAANQMEFRFDPEYRRMK